MQQHGNEILLGYRTTMGLNEVPCINNHLNSVHCFLQKRQILCCVNYFLYYSILFLLYKNIIVRFKKIWTVLKCPM